MKKKSAAKAVKSKKALSTQKKKPARKIAAKKAGSLADSAFNADTDPAHSPGHRKMNVKENFTEASGAKTHLQKSAVNNMANSDKMRRTNSANRRVITGAALGKTGRMNKETP